MASQAARAVIKHACANLKSLQTKHSCIGARQDNGLAVYVSVGLLGSLIGVHWSLAASALAMLATAAALLTLP
jgi:hypothetical protein